MSGLGTHETLSSAFISVEWEGVSAVEKEV